MWQRVSFRENIETVEFGSEKLKRNVCEAKGGGAKDKAENIDYNRFIGSLRVYKTFIYFLGGL